MKNPSLIEILKSVESQVSLSINALAQVGSEPLTEKQAENLSTALSSLHVLSISINLTKTVMLK